MLIILMAITPILIFALWGWATNDSLGTLARWQFLLDHPELWPQALWSILVVLFWITIADTLLYLSFTYRMRGGKTRAELEVEGKWKR